MRRFISMATRNIFQIYLAKTEINNIKNIKIEISNKTGVDS